MNLYCPGCKKIIKRTRKDYDRFCVRGKGYPSVCERTGQGCYLQPGRTFRLNRRKTGKIVFVDRCCECGLEHFNEITVNKCSITWKAWRTK